MEADEATSPAATGERRPFVPTRSTASNNWRLKDDSPRTEQPASAPPPRRHNNNSNDASRFQRRDNNNGYDYAGGSPRSGPFNRPSTDGPAEVTSPRLYVGNLLYSAQSEDIENFFVANGFKPTNISMSIDPMTGRNPSYCFVDLESIDDAKQAIEELNGKDIMGRTVRINPGVAKKEGGTPGRDGQRMRSYEGGNRGAWRDSEGDKEQSSPYRSTSDRWNRNDASSSPQQFSSPRGGAASQQQDQGKRLYVGGLPAMEPQSAVDAAMQDLFSGFEISTVSKLISPHPSKTAEPGDHHYLFVDLANLDDVDAAIETLNDSVSPFAASGSEGRLKVNRAKDNTGRKVYRDQTDRQGQGERSYGRPSWRGQ